VVVVASKCEIIASTKEEKECKSKFRQVDPERERKRRTLIPLGFI